MRASLELALESSFAHIFYVTTPVVHPINYPHRWRLPRKWFSMNLERIQLVDRIARSVIAEPRFRGRVGLIDSTSLTTLMEENALGCYDIRHYYTDVMDHVMDLVMTAAR